MQRESRLGPWLRPAAVAAVWVVALACGGESGVRDSGEPDGAAAGAHGEIRLVDAAGTEVVLEGPARRVVSLVPSATETLVAIAGIGVLVGRTDFDTDPRLAHLPSVGGGIAPDLEAIVSLRPDLVVRFAGEQDPSTPARLASLGIRHLAVRPDRVEDIYRSAELLGAATGFDASADELIERIRGELHAVAQSVRGLERLRVAYVLGGTPPWVAGPDTYIDELVSLVGGDNVFADLGALYAAVSPEELRSREIDVVLLTEGATFDAGLTPGVRLERVPSDLEIPGPGVIDAAHLLAELLHGRSEQ